MKNILNLLIDTDYLILKYSSESCNYILFNYNLYKQCEFSKLQSNNYSIIFNFPKQIYSKIDIKNYLDISYYTKKDFELDKILKTYHYKFITPNKKLNNVIHPYVIYYCNKIEILEYHEIGTEFFYIDNIFLLQKNNILNLLKFKYKNHNNIDIIIYIISGHFENENYPIDKLFKYLDKYNYIILFSDVELNALNLHLKKYEFKDNYIYINKDTNNIGEHENNFRIILL
jgi:hypothetical protein